MLKWIKDKWWLKILCHLLFWYLVWLFYKYFFGFNTSNLSYVHWFSTILIPVTCFVTYTNVYYLLPQFLMRQKYMLFTWYNLYVLVGATYSVTVLIYVGFIFRTDFRLEHIPPLSKSLPFILISVYIIVFIVLVFRLQYLNLQTLMVNKVLENNALLANLKLKEEELKFLKMQIHPHFLFNTLNTIYGLSLKKDDLTPMMILKLSELLDYILYQIHNPFVLLKDELNHLSNYIDLERIRFRDTLNITTEFKHREALQIPPMLLIPFVENSFKHGKRENGTLYININTDYDSGWFKFYISNSSELQPKSKGIGLENIKKRLELLYPDRYKLLIKEEKTRFMVELQLYMDEK